MNIISKISIAAISLFSISCTKEITPDLGTTESKIVIEGVISNDTNLQTIKIHKSVLFYDASNYPAVSSAIVKVSDNGDAPVSFLEVSPGVYQANFAGTPNHTYQLSVTIDGQEYKSTSTMPQPVSLTQIAYAKSTFSNPGGSTKYTITPIFIDPFEYKNYYKFNVVIDGKQDKILHVQDDVLINGLQNSFPIFRTDNDIVSGSNVKLIMCGTDEVVYNYFYVLQQNQEGNSTPNNPISNISSNTKSNVLGYFSAQNRQEMTIIIP